MTDVAPLATVQSAAVHISEVIREAKAVEEITARLQVKAVASASANKAAAAAANATVEDDDAAAAGAPSNPIDATDSDGRTAFHWCLALKRFDLAVALAGLGCAVATIDFDGTTTLTTACAVDAPADILSLIASKAADVFYCPKSSAALGFGAPTGGPNAANPFVNVAGTHFWNIADSAGNTPLLYLASRGNVKGLKSVLAMIPAGTTLRYRPAERAEEAKLRHQCAAAAAGGEGPSSSSTKVDDDAASPLSPPAAAAASSPAAASLTGSGSSPLDESLAAAGLAPMPVYCDVFAQNNRLQTALHRAVSKGSQEFVEELLSFVKKHLPAAGDAATVRNFVNAPDNQGNTVLHYASMENNEDMGKFLLRNGATRDAKNKKGQEFWQL